MTSILCYYLYRLIYTNMNEVIRLSISEAARIFGINGQTIRRAIKNQEIIYSVVRGRYQLNFESLLKWSQKRPAVKNKLEVKGIGQYVDRWKIKNPLFSPNPEALKKEISSPPPTLKTALPNTAAPEKKTAVDPNLENCGTKPLL